MSQASDLTARETEIIRILKVLRSASDKFVVIGGYAVSALSEHRFSVDCDVVVTEKGMRSFDKVLSREGYKKMKSTRLTSGVHGARTAKYARLIGGRRVAVDLYASSVLSRDTGGEWSYVQILSNSLETNVVGIADSIMARVAKRELLIAMKLHAARDTDLRDVVMLGEGADWDEVVDFANTGNKRKLIAQLDSAERRIGSKDFPSSLKAGFGLRIDVMSLIAGTLEGLKKVKKLTERK